jgi:drug/metabolite transporter (DMT)-like permease
LEKNQTKAYIFALSAVLLWSTVASAFKLSLRYMNATQLLFYASLLSLFFLLGIVTYLKKWYLLRSYSMSTYVKLAILGLLNPFIYYLVLFHAYELLPAQEAQPINYTWALMLSYLSVFILKHRLTLRDIIAGLICYFGVFVISTHGALFSFSFSNPFGVALALCSTILWSLYWLYNTKLHVDPSIGLLINFLAGVPAIAIYMVWSNTSFNCSLYALLGASYVGLFEMGITFVLWLQAMKYSTNTSKIANLIFISPFLSLLFISLFVGEKILFSTFIGLILIILGLLIQQRDKKVNQ